jgi:UPF0755 protein
MPRRSSWKTTLPKIDLSKIRERLGRRGQLAVAGAFVVLGLLGSFLWLIHTPASPGGAKVLVTIPRGAGLSQVTDTLRQEHLIRAPVAFKTWMWLSGSAHRIQPGSYELSSAMNYREIRAMITNGRGAEQRVTIPEGWTLREIATQLGKQGIVEPEAFIAAAKVSNFSDVLPGQDPALPLEGYLFPDTYFFEAPSTSEQVIRRLLANLADKLGPLEGDIQKSGLTLPQVINIASIVERETRGETDMRLVADILIKRFKQDIALQADATSLYEIGDFKHVLTEADLQKQTPYNTRINKGLPPTPIGNPGIMAIRAVLNPEPSPYLYYITGKDGKMYYARTLDEHNANVARHLR